MNTGYMAPFPPPVGTGLGTGSTGMMAPPLQTPGTVIPRAHFPMSAVTPSHLYPIHPSLRSTALVPQSQMGLTNQISPTMLTPLTPLGANPALPVHMSPAAGITPMKPVSPVLPATPVTPGLIQPVSPAMPLQRPIMTSAMSPFTSGTGMPPTYMPPTYMPQQPLLLPAHRTAAAMNLNSAPNLPGSGLHHNPAMFTPVKQPLPLPNGRVSNPGLGGVNYVPQSPMNMGTQFQNSPTVPSCWVLMQNPPVTSMVGTQIQPFPPVANIQTVSAPVAANGSQVFLPQAQLQSLAARSEITLPQMQYQPVARSQVMLPQLTSVAQPQLPMQTVLLVQAPAGGGGAIGTMQITPTSLMGSGTHFVLQPSQVATVPMTTNQGTQIILQPSQMGTVPIATTQEGQFVFQPTQMMTVSSAPPMSQPPLPVVATSAQGSQRMYTSTSQVGFSQSTPPNSQARVANTAVGSQAAAPATTNYYYTPVLTSGLPNTDTMSSSSSDSSL